MIIRFMGRPTPGHNPDYTQIENIQIITIPQTPDSCAKGALDSGTEITKENTAPVARAENASDTGTVKLPENKEQCPDTKVSGGD